MEATSSANASSKEEMKIDPQRATQLAENLSKTVAAVQAASKGGRSVRLVAVSKLKPASDILSLATQASNPHLHFGENYSQELLQKAPILPQSIRWHFIGALQTNKCKPLAEQVPNLWAVESVDTAKKADALEKGRAALFERGGSDGAEKLRVYVQVNTSGEDSKSGVEPGDQAVALCRHVRDSCPHLQLQGLMTIGAIARSIAASSGEGNQDFKQLKLVKAAVEEALGREKMGDGDGRGLELSMGMSADFEEAISQGSDEVRVGTGIFGERPAKESNPKPA